MIIVITFGFCSSCTRKDLTNEEANKLFLQVVNRKPIFCGSTLIKNAPRIIGLYEKENQYGGKDAVVSTLARVAGNWQVIAQAIVEKDAEDEEIQKGIELVTVGSKKYLYFSRQLRHQGTMYNGLGFIEFLVYSLADGKAMALKFSGRDRGGAYVDEHFKIHERPSKIEGDFENLADFKDHTDLLKFLESKALECALIYRPTAKDLDINNAENYAKKWERENPDAHEAEKSGWGWKSITFPYYQENLFEKEGIRFSGETRVENETYVVATWFAGPVLGFNKREKQYFVIWIPQGMGVGGAWGLRSYHIKLKNPSTVIIRNEYNVIEINIEKKIFRVERLGV
jgi:hypothetical protein